ncbi:hypothetical protein [Gloeocapsopsis sp. IPPAS B-1203]|nr:hypothetical protein [Gloeocapsopsis sp. IPPAS B-1203]
MQHSSAPLTAPHQYLIGQHCGFDRDRCGRSCFTSNDDRTN